MVFSNLKNRLCSRARVTSLEFQDALGLKNRLRSRARVEPNRDLVFRDQKVLPEVRNQPLLPRDFSAIQPSEILS